MKNETFLFSAVLFEASVPGRLAANAYIPESGFLLWGVPKTESFNCGSKLEGSDGVCHKAIGKELKQTF